MSALLGSFCTYQNDTMWVDRWEALIHARLFATECIVVVIVMLNLPVRASNLHMIFFWSLRNTSGDVVCVRLQWPVDTCESTVILMCAVVFVWVWSDWAVRSSQFKRKTRNCFVLCPITSMSIFVLVSFELLRFYSPTQSICRLFWRRISVGFSEMMAGGVNWSIRSRIAEQMHRNWSAVNSGTSQPPRISSGAINKTDLVIYFEYKSKLHINHRSAT